MKQIGILTFHSAINYGAVLQCYCLQKLLLRLGHQVIILNYRPRKAEVFYLKKMLLTRHFFKNILKIIKFSIFVKRYLRLSKKFVSIKNMPKEIYKLTDIVVGSDEVWNIDSFRGYDEIFFLNFPITVNRLSYAASSGNCTGFSNKSVPISHSIDKFRAISVRDLKTFENINDISSKKVHLHLDPTLITDVMELVPAKSKTCFRNKYVFTYCNFNVVNDHHIKTLRNKLKLPFYACGCINSTLDKSMPSLSIEDWIDSIKNSQACVTSFFHGIIFSLYFNKDVYTVLSPDKSSKIGQLIDDLKLDVETLPHSILSLSPLLKLNKTSQTEYNLRNSYEKTVSYFDSFL